MKISDIILENALEEENLEELIGIKNSVSKLPQDPKFASVPYGINAGPEGRNRPLGQDWHDVMSDNGFTALGAGAFGTVWTHPQLPYVLKVFSADDRAYIDWIMYARQHKDNPHMPRFISPRLTRINDNIVAVRMERLDPIEAGGRRVTYQSAQLIQMTKFSGFDLPSQVVKALGYMSDQDNLQYYCQRYAPQWLAALDLVRQFVDTTGYELDLHDKNVMDRGQFTLVITDPVADRGAIYKRLIPS